MFPEGVTAKNGFSSLKLKTVKAMALKKVFWFLIVVGLCVCVCTSTRVGAFACMYILRPEEDVDVLLCHTLPLWESICH